MGELGEDTRDLLIKHIKDGAATPIRGQNSDEKKAEESQTFT